VTALGAALTHPAAVAEAAVEQLEDLDVVARRRHVGVGGDDQRRDLEPSDLLGEVEVGGHRLANLVQQPGKSSGRGATRW
jgi:hypothetical protein